MSDAPKIDLLMQRTQELAQKTQQLEELAALAQVLQGRLSQAVLAATNGEAMVQVLQGRLAKLEARVNELEAAPNLKSVK